MEMPPLTPLAAAALRVGTPERILQVGCGDGDAALFLAREFPHARVRGVDADEAAIRRATARIGLDPEGRIAFKTGSRRDLPFPEDLFDLVALLDTTPSPGEVVRVLRPGGRLIVAYSNRDLEPRGFRAGLRERRLARLGIEPLEYAEAGDGSFSVARLRGELRATPAD